MNGQSTTTAVNNGAPTTPTPKATVSARYTGPGGLPGVIIKLPVKSIRRLEWDVDASIGIRDYIAVCRAEDLVDDFEAWLEVNPRCPRIETKVSKDIELSATDPTGIFPYLNRGLTILARKTQLEPDGKTISIWLDDPTIHGVADGGTSFWTLRTLKASKEEGDVLPEIRVEIISGINDEEMGPLSIAELCEARNTSNPVLEVSHMNAQGWFDEIREVLCGQPYDGLIAYSEAEWLDAEGNVRKPIDVLDIVSALLCFDIEDFDGDNHPVIAYSGKKRALKFYCDHFEHVHKIIPLLPEILAIYDTIHQILPPIWNGKGGKFGKLTGVRRIASPKKLHFLPGEATNYIIPASLKLPLLGACRSFLIKKKHGYGFAMDVKVQLRAGLGARLATKLSSLIINNNQIDRSRFGKSMQVWDSLYSAAETYLSRTSRV